MILRPRLHVLSFPDDNLLRCHLWVSHLRVNPLRVQGKTQSLWNLFSEMGLWYTVMFFYILLSHHFTYSALCETHTFICLAKKNTSHISLRFLVFVCLIFCTFLLVWLVCVTAPVHNRIQHLPNGILSQQIIFCFVLFPYTQTSNSGVSRVQFNTVSTYCKSLSVFWTQQQEQTAANNEVCYKMSV